VLYNARLLGVLVDKHVGNIKHVFPCIDAIVAEERQGEGSENISARVRRVEGDPVASPVMRGEIVQVSHVGTNIDRC
jgi:hypothetical protein